MQTVYWPHCNADSLLTSPQCTQFTDLIAMQTVYWPHSNADSLLTLSQCRQFADLTAMQTVYWPHSNADILLTSQQCRQFTDLTAMQTVHTVQIGRLTWIDWFWQRWEMLKLVGWIYRNYNFLFHVLCNQVADEGYYYLILNSPERTNPQMSFLLK